MILLKHLWVAATPGWSPHIRHDVNHRVAALNRLASFANRIVGEAGWQLLSVGAIDEFEALAVSAASGAGFDRAAVIADVQLVRSTDQPL